MISRRCRCGGAARLGSRVRSKSPRCLQISPRSTTWRWPCRRIAAIPSVSGARPAPHPELRAPALAALTRVGLAARADVRVARLSHGEHRALEIALALATAPRLLLLDEPMAGMGAAQASAGAPTTPQVWGLKGDCLSSAKLPASSWVIVPASMSVLAPSFMIE